MKKALFLPFILLLLLAGAVLSAEAVKPDPAAKRAPEGVRPVVEFDEPGDDVNFMESFEFFVPPIGWDLWVWDTTDPTYTWHKGSGGVDGFFMANVHYDAQYSMTQDEWLVTPPMDMAMYPNMSISFWWMMSYYWGVSPYDNYDFEVWVSDDEWTSGVYVWNEHVFGPFNSYTWYYTELDLSFFAGSSDVRVAFVYYGFNGAQLGLDYVVSHTNTAELELARPVVMGIPVCMAGPVVPNGSTGDPILDAGEEVVVTLETLNFGLGAATNVTAMIVPLSENARVVEGFETCAFPDIPVGETRTCLNLPKVKAHFWAECGEVLTWGVIFYADQGVWTDTFELLVGDAGNLFPFETFDRDPTFPPPDWTVVVNGDPGGWWETNEYWNRPNYAGGEGMCAAADSDMLGSGTTMDTELRTPVFSLAGIPGAALEFIGAYKDIGIGDWFDVDISTDGGSTWHMILHWWYDHHPYGPGEEISVDLANSIGQANCMIRFHYYGTWDWWAQVDNVGVRQTASGGCVDLLHEHFDPIARQFPPFGWTVTDLAGTGQVWSSAFDLGMPNHTNGSGDCATANSDYYGLGSGLTDTELYSPPIDLTPPSRSIWEATLSFESYFEDFTGAGQAWLDVTNDGGTTWANLLYFTEDEYATFEEIDLTPYVGDTIQLRWRYTDDDNWAWYWDIDDVMIEICEVYCEMEECLGIECFLLVSDDMIQRGETVFFNATADTNCPTGDMIYHLDFGDGKTTLDPNTSHVYDTAGVYEVVLTVLANDCSLICEKTHTIIVEDWCNFFIYDNDGTANLCLDMATGRYQFEIFDGHHRGVYNGWGYFADCWFPEEEEEVAEFLCFYTYSGYDWYMKFCFDMTHKIYRGDILFYMGDVMGAYTIFDNRNWVE